MILSEEYASPQRPSEIPSDLYDPGTQTNMVSVASKFCADTGGDRADWIPGSKFAIPRQAYVHSTSYAPYCAHPTAG